MVRMTDTERETAIAQAREQMMAHALRMDWPEAHAAQRSMMGADRTGQRRPASSCPIQDSPSRSAFQQ